MIHFDTIHFNLKIHCINFISQIALVETTARCRLLSLKCLLKIRAYPYPKIHPLKPIVVKGLGKIIDDRKRVVRILAAKVRNEWLVIE